MFNSFLDALHSFYARVQSRQFIRYLLVFSFFFLVFFSVYFSVNTFSSSDDQFFHIQFANQMRNNGFLSSFQNFNALYLSKMADGKEYFIYYNFLFYIVLIPFTFITPLYLGMKLYAVLAVSLAFFLLYWCLKQIEVKYPFGWAFVIVAFSSFDSLYRFFLARPYTFAPILLLLIFLFLYKKNYAGLFLLTVVYFFWHSATFFLPVCVTVIYCIIEKFYGHKGDYKKILYSFAAILVSILLVYIISPGFILYMKEIILGVFTDTVWGNHVSIVEGGEVYAVDILDIVKTNAFVFTAFILTLSIDLFTYVGYKSRKITELEYMGVNAEKRIFHTAILLTTILFFLGTVAVTGRFKDFFTFFVGLYVILSFDYLAALLRVHAPRIIQQGLITGLIVTAVYAFISNSFFLQKSLAYGPSANKMYAVGSWLKANTEPGDKIFLSSWDSFPMTYYYSPQNQYSTGIEPRFLYKYDPELYWLSVHIPEHGYACSVYICDDLADLKMKAASSDKSSLLWAKNEGDKIATIIKERFGASYIVTSDHYQSFNYILANNARFKREMHDEAFGYSIYDIE
jgi:hypothetical protein